jgi:hypothetical protein
MLYAGKQKPEKLESINKLPVFFLFLFHRSGKNTGSILDCR